MTRFVEGDMIRTELEEKGNLDLYDRLKGKENSQVKHFKMV